MSAVNGVVLNRERRDRVQAVIPMLTTSPGWDLRLILLALPVLWVLGFEQVLPVLMLVLVAGRRVLTRGAVPSSRLLWLVLSLVALQFASLTMVDSVERILTFTRTLSTYVAAVGILVIVLSEARTGHSLRLLLGTATLGMVFAAIVSVTAIFGIARFEFTAPIAALLPDWIRDTDYGRLIAIRKMGGDTWFLGGWVFRTSSIFLYPNTYAVALAAYVPVAIFLTGTARGRRGRVGWAIATALLLVALASTTSRTSITAVAVGTAGWAFVSLAPLGRSLAATAATLVLTLVAFLAPFSSEGLVDATVGARGFGSANARATIYTGTLAGIAERPILGWATERDPPEASGFRYPFGSHSYYLGTAFRFGIPALLVLGWIYLRSWRSLADTVRSSPRRTRPLIALFGWSLVTMLLTAVTTTHDLDLMTMLYLWVVLAVLEGARTNPRLLTDAA